MEITATKIEKEEQMPGDVPENAILLYGVDLKPDGLTFSKPAKLSFANTLGLPAGLEFPLVYWDEGELEWKDGGMAKVSDDGAWMECTIQHFTYYQGHGSGIGHASNPNGNDSSPGGESCAVDIASKIGYYSGSLTKEYTISQTRSLGVSTGATIIYNSSTAFPNTLIATSSNTEVIPKTLTWLASIEGNLIESIFKAVPGNTYQAFLFSGKNGRGEWLPTGSYKYKIKLSNNYFTNIYTSLKFGGDPLTDTRIAAPELMSMSSFVDGRFAINNQLNSRFGAGWSLDGLQRLHIDHDGYVVITHGDGSRPIFTPQDPVNGEVRFKSPVGDYSMLVKHPGGDFTRFMKDGTRFHFSSRGFHTITIDRNANSTFYSYNDDRLSSITDPAGRVTHFHYDSRDYLTSVTDPVGRITRFEIDGNGDLIKITGPDSSINEYEYNSDHLLTFHTDPRNSVTEYRYKIGRISKVIRANGQDREYEIAQLKGLINDIPAGHGTGEEPAEPVYPQDIFSKSFSCSCGGPPATYRFDRLGGALEYIDALGRRTLTERDANSNPTKITRPNGEVTTMSYDSKGNLLSSKEASNGAVTSFTYDHELSQVTSVTDPKGNKTQINYDPRGNPIEIIDALGNKTVMTYNGRGLRTSIKDALENTTTFSYDSKGNLISTTDPMGNKTELTYDDAGNVVASKDAEGNTTEFSYDEMNRLISVKDAEGGITKYDYDQNDNLIKVTDANVNATEFGYDKVNELISTTDPLRRAESFEYNVQGNLIARRDRNGQTTSFLYDDANQLTKKVMPHNETMMYYYDASGNASLIQSPGILTTMGYDKQNRLASSYVTPLPDGNIDAVITGKRHISLGDTSLDGLDILIQDAELTIDGKHIFGDVKVIRSNIVVNQSISDFLRMRNLELLDNSILTHSEATATITYCLGLDITGKLSIDDTSKIDVTGKGYLQGRTIGNTTDGGSLEGSGGSYGGKGAVGYLAVCDVYGNFADPDELGSGGGIPNSGSGGGLVRINTGELILNGGIMANGASGSSGGSGGCINITTGIFTGNGYISAIGGNGELWYYHHGGGGGGRIAIRYTDISGFDISRIDASGGKTGGLDTNYGGAGTIYLKGTSQTYGDLIVDNKGKNGANTPLRAVGIGTITALTPDTLADDNASFPVPDVAAGKLGLIGLRLNPNYPDNKVWTYRIINNTDKTITTDPADGNLMTVASVGDTYIGEYWLNNLTITNGAKVVTADNVWYDTITLTGGSIDANNIKQVGFMGNIPEQEINIGMNDDPNLVPVDMPMIASWANIAEQLKNTEARRHRGNSFEFPIIGVSSAKSYDPPSVPVYLNVLSITSNSEVLAYFQDTEYGESNFSLPVLAESSDSLSVPPCLRVSTFTDNSEVSAYSQSTGYEKSNFNLPVLAENSDLLSVPPCLRVSNLEKTSQIDMDPSYTYDLNGNRDTMTGPTGTTTYKYDKLNRLESITNPKGQIVTFEYDAIGRRTKMTYPNGVVTTYTYDKASRLLTLEAKLGANIITSFEYAYDKVGNRLSMTDLDGKHDYTYDDLYRLTDAAHPQTFNPAEHFTYDPVGNRLSSHLSSSYDYDDANELLQDAKFDYDYDNNGNMIKQTDKSTNQSQDTPTMPKTGSSRSKSSIQAAT